MNLLTANVIVRGALLLFAAVHVVFLLWHAWLIRATVVWPASARSAEREAIAMLRGDHLQLIVVLAVFAVLCAFKPKQLAHTRLGRILLLMMAAFYAARGGKELWLNSRPFAGIPECPAAAELRLAFGHGVTPSDGRALYDLITGHGYKRALDVGTAHGYAALWMALAMERTGGRVTTLEIDAQTAAQARKHFDRSRLSNRIESRVGDALVEIPKIKGDFDFVLLDTGAPLNKQFLDALRHRVAPGGMIAAHNADSFRAVQPEFLRAITHDPGLDTGVIPTTSGGISTTFRRAE